MNFEKKLKSGKFVITAEVSPPRGVDVSSFIERTLLLKDRIDAVNVTDFLECRSKNYIPCRKLSSSKRRI